MNDILTVCFNDDSTGRDVANLIVSMGRMLEHYTIY